MKRQTWTRRTHLAPALLHALVAAPAVLVLVAVEMVVVVDVMVAVVDVVVVVVAELAMSHALR